MELTISLPENQPDTTIRTLLEDEWLIPRKVRHFLRTRKNVRLNQQPVMFHDIARAKDVITLYFEDDDYPKPIISLGQADKVSILFEDEHIIIVDKPAGVKTHPNQPNETDTLFNHVAAYLVTQNQVPYVVHRLDKETSGAIVFAKNPIVLPILGRMLEKKEITRLYEAEIDGQLTSPSLTINKKIGRDRHDRRKRIVDSRNGQHAITHVTVNQTMSRTSWVTCQLETGRTHQIRVHLAAIGHPIMGDPLYHPRPNARKRLQLHAKQLSLQHPFTKKLIDVSTDSRLAPN